MERQDTKSITADITEGLEEEEHLLKSETPKVIEDDKEEEEEEVLKEDVINQVNDNLNLPLHFSYPGSPPDFPTIPQTQDKC